MIDTAPLLSVSVTSTFPTGAVTKLLPSPRFCSTSTVKVCGSPTALTPFGLMVIPVIGPYVLFLLTPMFLAGLMTACRDQEAGREVAELGLAFDRI